MYKVTYVNFLHNFFKIGYSYFSPKYDLFLNLTKLLLFLNLSKLMV